MELYPERCRIVTTTETFGTAKIEFRSAIENLYLQEQLPNFPQVLVCVRAYAVKLYNAIADAFYDVYKNNGEYLDFVKNSAVSYTFDEILGANWKTCNERVPSDCPYVKILRHALWLRERRYGQRVRTTESPNAAIDPLSTELEPYTRGDILNDIRVILEDQYKVRTALSLEFFAKRELAESEGASEGCAPVAVFPRRTEWLDARLLERGWSTSDPSGYEGPDRKTIQKILRGEAVRNDVLQKLADALSKRYGKVNVLDIPQD